MREIPRAAELAAQACHAPRAGVNDGDEVWTHRRPSGVELRLLACEHQGRPFVRLETGGQHGVALTIEEARELAEVLREHAASCRPQRFAVPRGGAR